RAIEGKVAACVAFARVVDVRVVVDPVTLRYTYDPAVTWHHPLTRGAEAALAGFSAPAVMPNWSPRRGCRISWGGPARTGGAAPHALRPRAFECPSAALG